LQGPGAVGSGTGAVVCRTQFCAGNLGSYGQLAMPVQNEAGPTILGHACQGGYVGG
jgi:hypothetical protein